MEMKCEGVPCPHSFTHVLAWGFPNLGGQVYEGRQEGTAVSSEAPKRDR